MPAAQAVRGQAAARLLRTPPILIAKQGHASPRLSTCQCRFPQAEAFGTSVDSLTPAIRHVAEGMDGQAAQPSETTRKESQMTQQTNKPSFPLVRPITEKYYGVFIADYNGQGYCSYRNEPERAQAFADWLIANNITTRNQLNAVAKQDKNLARNVSVNF